MDYVNAPQMQEQPMPTFAVVSIMAGCSAISIAPCFGWRGYDWLTGHHEGRACNLDETSLICMFRMTAFAAGTGLAS